MAEILQLLKPIPITSAMLTACNVAEPATGDTPDPAAWSSVTTYTVGQRVFSAATHTIYEATTAASNTNKDPDQAVNAAFWTTVGATNRWRMFDQKSTSQTSRVGTLTFTVNPGSVFNGFGLVNVTGADTVRLLQTDPVSGTVYDQTTSLRAPPSSADYYDYCFDAVEVKDYFVATDLPTFSSSSVAVTLTASNGTSVVGCGAALIGKVYSIGNGVQYGARIGITDYSKKKVNSFGDMEFVEGAFSSKASFQMWVDKNDVESVKKLLSSVRAIPCLYQGTEFYGRATLVYGAYKDWEITISYFDVSMLNIELEGLTEQ